MSVSYRQVLLHGSLILLFTLEGQLEAQPGAFHAAEEIQGRIENLSAGRRYGLEAPDGRRQIHQQEVWSPAADGEPTFTLPTPARRPSSNETVSVARLLHAAPAKAAKLFEKAMAGADLRKSIALLERAIEEHPDYIEAHHNLAVRLGRVREYDRAVKEFEAVLELDPSSAMAWANLGVTLDAMGDSAAAETAARHALTLEPRSAIGSYLLGSILLRRGADLDSAATLLGNAADRFPAAALLQVDALLAAGEIAPARQALRSLAAAANGVH